MISRRDTAASCSAGLAVNSSICPRSSEIPSLALQLLSAIDITVMNMALPKIQHAMDVSPTGLSWVLNAYTLV
ncbi:hypothetical protein OG806_41270 [Streptomyces sp. NBC_00882]|uniref:hypothetical protein n=1 Tax=Streptomyces TaxID=1883 RepID=UPI003863BCA2|nr:hypothetical protein OG806_41270 [Streptomyces sp. NBC_00882]WSZ62332.1 hypothetical protein OH824_40195 [Streptomyces canus]